MKLASQILVGVAPSLFQTKVPRSLHLSDSSPKQGILCSQCMCMPSSTTPSSSSKQGGECGRSCKEHESGSQECQMPLLVLLSTHLMHQHCRPHSSSRSRSGSDVQAGFFGVEKRLLTLNPDRQGNGVVLQQPAAPSAVKGGTRSQPLIMTGLIAAP